MVLLQGRRQALATLLAGCAAGSLPGCATPGAGEAAPVPDEPRPWRTLHGGYLATLPAAPGRPPLPGGGAFVRFGSVVALALRGVELLVADAAAARLWRCDLAGGQISAVDEVPVSPRLQLLLGPDLTAWALDPPSQRLWRVARDGTPRPPVRLPSSLATPVTMTLADAGATLLVGDGSGAHWLEWRGAGGVPRVVEPQGADGRRVSGVDALALAADGQVLVLDRLAARVHRCTRAGLVLGSLGLGELHQPVGVAAGPGREVWVHDAHDDSLVRLRDGAPLRRWPAQAFAMARIGAFAVDGRYIATGDVQRGTVTLHTLPVEAR